MKSNNTVKLYIILFITFASVQSIFAQSKADVFNENVPVTWLGVDYSLTKFIGTPTDKSVTFSPWTVVKSQDNGIVSNDEFRDMFTAEWNQLFLDKPKNFNIAKAIHRKSVTYAVDVCLKANQLLSKKEFFTNNPADFKTINEATIATAVKNYDFQNNQGVGMMFFVEGMDKGIAQEGVWVTFVDMKSKTVLFTTYEAEKPGGVGFKNYWVTPLVLIIKKMDSKFYSWK